MSFFRESNIFYETRLTSQLDFHDAVTQARDRDPEYFYSYIDFLIERGEEFRRHVSWTEFFYQASPLLNSTYPRTQYFFAKAALQGEFVLPFEMIKELLIKAIYGFWLLGKEGFHALALEAMQDFNNQVQEEEGYLGLMKIKRYLLTSPM